MELHERIKNIRNIRGIPQSVVAKELGITVQGYSMKELGQRSINADELVSIAAALKVSPTIFFDDKFHDKWIKKEKEAI